LGKLVFAGLLAFVFGRLCGSEKAEDTAKIEKKPKRFIGKMVPNVALKLPGLGTGAEALAKKHQSLCRNVAWN